LAFAVHLVSRYVTTVLNPQLLQQLGVILVAIVVAFVLVLIFRRIRVYSLQRGTREFSAS
jgi:hypothetical protein